MIPVVPLLWPIFIEALISAGLKPPGRPGAGGKDAQGGQELSLWTGSFAFSLGTAAVTASLLLVKVEAER